jgi:tetratricopeptide repeat protein
MRRLALAAIAALLITAGCQRASQTQAAAPTPVVDHTDEARKAMAAHNWAGAAEHLRAALQHEPESLPLHHNLAICASWLDRRDEATREFEWVVAHAPADSEESKTARRWLAGNSGTTPDVAGPAAGDANPGEAALRGTVMWAEPGQIPAPQSRLQLFLVGLPDTPTKDQQYMLRSDPEGHYEFKHVVAGSYKLIDGIGKPKWRLKVTLEPGQDLTLDLSPDNGLKVRDDFPQG